MRRGCLNGIRLGGVPARWAHRRRLASPDPHVRSRARAQGVPVRGCRHARGLSRSEPAADVWPFVRGSVQLSAEDVVKEVAKLRGELSAARAKLSGLEATRLGSSSKSASALKETLSTYDATHGELTAVRGALQHIHALVADSGAVDNSAQFQGGAGGRPSSASATSPPAPLEHRSSAPAKSAQAATRVSRPHRPINLGPITFLSPEDISKKFSVRPSPVLPPLNHFERRVCRPRAPKSHQLRLTRHPSESGVTASCMSQPRCPVADDACKD